jgi:ankyrin repeat protein
MSIGVRRWCRSARSLIGFGTLLLTLSAHAADSLPELVALGKRAEALERVAVKADVNERSADGSTALLWAVHHGDKGLIRALLDRGADPTLANEYGVTPLAAAAVEADFEIVQALLEAGADVESRNAEGQSALMVVARTGRIDTAKLLLERGASVNGYEQWGGQTALMWAAAQSQPEMIRVLLEHGAEVDVHGRAHDWQRRVTAEPRIKLMQTGGFTALLYAARQGCAACVEALVAGGADINLSDPNGVTPLLLALLNRNFDTALRLVELGADVNRWDWWGRSPLFVAVELNQVPNSSRGDLPSLDAATGLDLAKALLERGANANMRLKQQPPLRNPPNDRGHLDGSPDAFVLAIGATPLHAAAKAGDVAAVQLLVEHGADVAIKNVFSITPLLAGAGLGHRYAVLRETPIIGAFKTGEQARAIVELLHRAGARIDDVGVGTDRVGGQTAAHGAAQEGWPDVIELLHGLGGDIQRPNDKGLTPRAIAEAAGRSEVVELIDRLLDVQ